MRHCMFVGMVLLLLLGCLPLTASAQPAGGTITYVVQHGDTLAGIARRHCTTWQAIYDLNAATLGGNPNQVYPGIVLYVPAGCSGGYPSPGGGHPSPGGGSGGYDRGPGPHAWGSVWGGAYTVVQGDTLFSVSRRFGLTVQQMAAANDLCSPWWIYPGQRLVISGAYTPPSKPLPRPYPRPQPLPKPLPWPEPLPEPLPGPLPDPTGSPYITIISPVPDSALPPTFTVHGMGGALESGLVVIRARDAAGTLLAEGTTVLEGAAALTGGEGAWHITLTISVPGDVAGTLEAATPSGSAVIVQPVVVPVTFAGSGS